jgi:DNA-binding NarL/FixJ family response regulator
VALRCVIVDDNTGFLRAASTLLEEEGLRIVGTASNTAGAVRCAAELHPDVTLLDIDLHEESGFDLAWQLARDPELRPGALIFVSTHAEEDLADLIETSPAVGFLPKAALSAESIERLVRAAGDSSREG